MPDAWPGRALLHWPPLLAVILILGNDFWFRRRHPGLLSGKLSDVGICFLFPVVLVALWEWLTWFVALGRGRPWRRAGAWVPIAAALLASSYYGAMKLVPAFGRLHSAWLSVVFPWWSFRAGTPDPTDLVALVMVPVAVGYLRRVTSPSCGGDHCLCENPARSDLQTHR